eukprot:sb/3466280/
MTVHLNSTFPPDVVPGEIILSALSISSICIGLPAALLQLSYLVVARNERSCFANRLYLAICTVDVSILVCFVPVTASYIYKREPTLFPDWFCPFYGIVWFTLSRLSIVLIAILSVTRTFSLVRPFAGSPSLNFISVFITLASILLVVQFSVPFWHGGSYLYNEETVTCYPVDGPTVKISNAYQILILLEIVIPFFAILSSCIVSVVSLRSIHLKTSLAVGARKNGRASVTILLMTAVYLVFNVPFVMFVTGMIVKWFLHQSPKLDGYLFLFYAPKIGNFNFRHLLNFCETVSVALNSMSNAIVWIYRSTAMRSWLKGLGLITEDLKGSRPRTLRTAPYPVQYKVNT